MISRVNIRKSYRVTLRNQHTLPSSNTSALLKYLNPISRFPNQLLILHIYFQRPVWDPTCRDFISWYSAFITQLGFSSFFKKRLIISYSYFSGVTWSEVSWGFFLKFATYSLDYFNILMMLITTVLYIKGNFNVL